MTVQQDSVQTDTMPVENDPSLTSQSPVCSRSNFFQQIIKQAYLMTFFLIFI